MSAWVGVSFSCQQCVYVSGVLHALVKAVWCVMRAFTFKIFPGILVIMVLKINTRRALKDSVHVLEPNSTKHLELHKQQIR